MNKLFTAVVIATLVGLFVPHARSEPLYQTSSDGARVVLHSEPCQISAVLNLPRRATWHEGGGRVYEGCWGANQDSGMVVAYFDDKSVAAIPIRVFTKVVGV